MGQRRSPATGRRQTVWRSRCSASPGKNPDWSCPVWRTRPNLADDITYSGTVAAAMEGVVWGIPSIAVSLADSYQWDFAYAAEFAAHLADRSRPAVSVGRSC